MISFSYWSSSRHTLLNGLPCWQKEEIGGRIQALPALMLSPCAGGAGGWSLRLMFPHRDGGSSYLSRDLSEAELLDFLRSWQESPEETVRKWWPEVQWPLARAAGQSINSLEELGL